MAKAILGYMGGVDPRTAVRLASENRMLRQRVTDLETHVIRLQAENDALVAATSSELLSREESMQPA